MATRLMLIDDHPLVREGLRVWLECMEHLSIVGEADNADRAMQIAKECIPDLAIIDIGLGGVNGIELTRLLLKELPTMAILILTVHNGDDYVRQAIRAGARGYVLKDSPMKQITAAIDAVIAGGTYYSSAVTASIKEGAASSPLSQREREVLDFVVNGHSNKEIARLLNISVRTIETHRQTIRRKLGRGRAVDLVKHALKTGLMKI